MPGYRKILKRTSEQGMALVVVLWILTALTLLIASFSTIVKTNIMVAGADQRFSTFMTGIDAGLELAAFSLIDPKTNIEWSAPDRIQQATFNDQRLQFQINDPNGLIDLNNSDQVLLLNLLQQFTGNREQAEGIVEEILKKRQKGQPQSGSASQQAQRRNALRAISRQAQNKTLNFKDITDLRNLPGVSQELYNKIKPFITVFNATGAINPATAPFEVLSSVPKLNKPTIDELLKRRSRDHTDKKIYSDIISRNSKLLKSGRQKFFIVYVASPWNNTTKYIGRRYVIAASLNNRKPYHLLSWREYRPQQAIAK